MNISEEEALIKLCEKWENKLVEISDKRDFSKHDKYSYTHGQANEIERCWRELDELIYHLTK